MEESNHGTFKLSSAAGVDGGGTESLPDNSFADVSGNEEGDTRPKTVALLQEFIKKQYHQACTQELSG